jgi:hypothetical protein
MFEEMRLLSGKNDQMRVSAHILTGMVNGFLIEAKKKRSVSIPSIRRKSNA